MSQRMLPIPDGLEGERVDVALTRMLGLSRTKAAALIDAGLVLQDGRPLTKSDRLLVGSMLQVDPDALEPKSTVDQPPALVPGMRVLYDDD
ncbi:MAG: S4 domain-containing protein, partial [Actinomycetota bacterium]|nr:S4 domain-containing protein [Actinomycetota bacterium]